MWFYKIITMEILGYIIGFGILLAIGISSVLSIIKWIRKGNYVEFKK